MRHLSPHWPRFTTPPHLFGGILVPILAPILTGLIVCGLLLGRGPLGVNTALAQTISASTRPLELTEIKAQSKNVTSRISLTVQHAAPKRTRIQNIGTALRPKIFTLAAHKDTPSRLVIDLSQTDFTRSAKTTAAQLTTPHIQKIRMARRTGGVTRLVVEMNVGARYQSHHYVDGVLSIVIHAGAASKSAAKSVKSTNPVKRAPKLSMAVPTIKYRRFAGVPYPQLKPQSKQVIRHIKPKRKPVIVIDPGHGGYDPGAIGQKKVKEETITLAAALELRRQLHKTGRYTVVLTRTSDRYVDHDKRVLIARKAGADLFISLHADSLSKPSIRGASVYTLAARAQMRGQKLVNKQNWILDVDLASHSGAVGNILVDLAQRTTMNKSSQFADILVPQLKKNTSLLANTHRQAGYYVLLAPDVPAILLEMGFLSNLKDEKLLNSKSHRKKLMKSVTKAINLYFKS